MSPSSTPPSSVSSLSLLDTESLSARTILTLFEEADQLDLLGKAHGHFFVPGKAPSQRVVGCLFFEASTRTRMSFQMASYRLGHQVLTMEMNAASSLSKGETYEDTVLNIAAMKPDVLIVRYGTSVELDQLLPRLPMPVVNAGSGTSAHPTQALLDAYTIHRELGSVEGKKVLIVGDIAHSRVARSNFDVLNKLGAEVAVCGPSSMIPNDLPAHVKCIGTIEEALGWADVYMALRIQLERHGETGLAMGSNADYHSQFGLSQPRLKLLKKDAIVMHPGPINHGVEFSHDVSKDPRNRVMNQVTNGVLIRAALLQRALSQRTLHV